MQTRRLRPCPQTSPPNRRSSTTLICAPPKRPPQLAEGELAQALGANPSLSGSALQNGPAELELIQPMSLTGEGLHARRAASARVVQAGAALHRTELVVAHRARSAYVDALVAIRVADVAEEGMDLSVRLRDAVVRLHEEGEASMLDLNLARLAQAQAASRVLEAHQIQADALAALAAVVVRRVGPESLVRDLLMIVPEATGPTTERSDVLAAQAALIGGERSLATQQAASLPSVGLGARIETEGGVTTAGPALTVELPLFNRNQAGRAGAQGELIVAEALLAETRAVASTELVTTRDRDRLARETLASIGEDPVAAAVAALDSVEAGYLAGEIDLTSTVLLQAQILDGETAVVELEGHVAHARLDLLLATEDPALLGGAR